MDTEVILAADELRKAGISILITDIAKNPVGGKWGAFKNRVITREELEKRCADPDATGVATIGGKVSRGLETIDFEGVKKVGKCCFSEWAEIVQGHSPELYGILVINTTPNEGYHVRYHYEAEKYDGRLHLAVIPNTNIEKKVKVVDLIETRGEGHYALCPPSPGLNTEGESGSYEILQGNLLAIPTIPLEDRNFLISICKSFNEVATAISSPLLSPGTDFMQRSDHRALLEKHGWTLELTRENGVEYWRRPGKEENWSATWGFHPNQFYIFTSSSEPFIPDKPYNLFAVY